MALMVEGRVRLDHALVAQGLVPSRQRAQAMVRAGLVRVAGAVADRPDQMVDPSVRLGLNHAKAYVSRGGDKLAAALDAFGIDPTGRVALDVGASTGGFTDILLQRGAARVIAVDVGYGQLAWSLRQDPRVTVLERVNIRHLDRLPVPADLAVIDVSFISLDKILGPVAVTLRSGPGHHLVALVKPQFEAGRAHVKKGVIRDAEIQAAVTKDLAQTVAALGWSIVGIMESPILGRDGNREFLLGARHD